jgi:hypothetical protein
MVANSVFVEEPASPAGIDRRDPRVVQRDPVSFDIREARDPLLVRRRIDRLRELHLWDLGRRRHLDLHHQRECVSRHIVRDTQRSTGILAQLGIVLTFQQRLREGRVRLVHENDVRFRSIATTVQLESRASPANLYVAADENPE